MGKLSDYKNENPSVFKTQNTSGTNQGQEKENMPIKVTGYEIGGTLDTNFILGKRIDTKEDVKVRLEEITQSPTSKYKRVEVSEFATPSNKKRHVAVGCPMVFENARKSPDGSYMARWAVVLDRDPNGTNVIVVNSLLRNGVKDKDGQKQEWFQIQVLIPTEPKVVENKEDFDTSLAKYLTPKFSGSNPQCFVRITDDSNDVHVIEVKPLRIEAEGFKRVASEGSKSVENFEKTNKEEYDMIISFLTTDEVKVELLPNSVLFPGTATKENMELMHKSTKQILVESFHVKTEDSKDDDVDGVNEKTQAKYPKLGFLTCVIATRMYPDGTPYLTYIRPLKLFDQAVSIEEIKKVTVR